MLGRLIAVHELGEAVGVDLGGRQLRVQGAGAAVDGELGGGEHGPGLRSEPRDAGGVDEDGLRAGCRVAYRFAGHRPRVRGTKETKTQPPEASASL